MARRRDPGFTLLEILVVVALVSIVAATLSMRLAGSSSVSLRASGRVLVSELEFAAQRALATGRAHRWTVDLDDQRFRLEAQAPPPADTPDLAPGDSTIDLAPPLAEAAYAPVEIERYGQWHELDELTIGIDEIELGGESHISGETAIHFAPDGGADPARIWLLDPDSRELEIEVTGFTGEIVVGEVVRRE